MATENQTVQLPEGVELAPFVPVAYYDKHMDCIRVITHDRSVTEHRLSETFTLYECNHRSQLDPEFVGFTIKGVRRLFAEVGLDIDGVYRLADVFDRMIKHKPGSVMSTMARLMLSQYKVAGDFALDMREAA